MAISLQKGQKVDLTKGSPGFTRAFIGLGWDTSKYYGGADFDLRAAAFMLGENGKVASDADFVFYNNPRGRGGSVIHTGDNLTGAGMSDDEVILIDFSKIPPDVSKIAITVTIHEAAARGQNFGQVSSVYARIAQITNDKNIKGVGPIRYDLGDDFSVETAIVVCEIYKYGGEWKFNAVGFGYQGGLAALCKSYGVKNV